MMDFPNSPNDGDIINQPNGIVYRWIAALTRWEIAGAIPAPLPIGYIYVSVLPANPADIFGYGVWEKFSEGRALMGSGSGAGLTPRAVLAEAGAEKRKLGSHTHSTNHSHTGSLLSGGEHTHAITGGQLLFRADDDHDIFGGDVDDYENLVGSATSTGSTHTHTVTVNNSAASNLDNTGDNSADNNMQPFLVAFIWERVS